jgi:hypothetical protein
VIEDAVLMLWYGQMTCCDLGNFGLKKKELLPEFIEILKREENKAILLDGGDLKAGKGNIT